MATQTAQYDAVRTGQALRSAIDAHGTSVRAIAREIDMPATTLFHVLGGRVPLTIGVLLRLAGALGVPPEQLVPGMDRVTTLAPDRSLDIGSVGVADLVAICARAGIWPPELLYPPMPAR